MQKVRTWPNSFTTMNKTWQSPRLQYLFFLCIKSLNPKKYISQPRGRSLQGLLQKNSFQWLLEEHHFTKIGTRRILCKYCYKNSLQGSLQEGFLENLLQGAITMDASKKSTPTSCREKQLWSYMAQEHKHKERDRERQSSG